MLARSAGVAKLVYAGDSKSPGRKATRVRIPPPAPGPRRPEGAYSVGPTDAERRHGRHNTKESTEMRFLQRRAAVIVLAAVFAAVLAAPSLVTAQMREFTGRIDRVNKKKMIVDNRMGDKVSFVPIDSTEVSGEGKEKWKDLKNKDWVTVSWKMLDKPRKAYKVEVLPPRED